MKHLVDIHVDRCIGCTRCMRVCPTEAIRIKNEKALLIKERCIFCGNCILNCHKSAYKVYSDSFANLNKHKVNVVILPSAIYGMTKNMKELGGIYQILYDYGFDEVFDLSGVVELLSQKITEYIKQSDKTYILSQCPTVIRLIQLKYPSLLSNLLPFDFPYEIGAKIARKKLSQKYQIKEEDIGISYISECLSNFIAIKEGLGKKKSNVDYVFLFNDLFRNSIDSDQINTSVAKNGIQFSKAGGFEYLSNKNEVLSVDGVKELDEILERIYLNRLDNVKLVEAYSCIGGCVGGNFTIENTFVAKWKVNQFHQTIDESIEYVNQFRHVLNSRDWMFTSEVEALSPYKLSENINQSIVKMNQINQILKQLPNIDCCACGSPSCRALAEDVVNHEKTLDDCYILKRGDET